eukprot:scaffold1424_cov168-Amphora_coffeaeformis.AAC.3
MDPSSSFSQVSGTSASNELSSELDSDEEEEARQRTQENLHTKFRLRLYASNLPRRGKLRNRLPDSFAMVTTAQGSSRTLASGGVRLGATEVIRNSRNPAWTETFVLDYTYGTQLYFNVLILEPSDGNEYSMGDGFGSAVFEVADVIATKHRTRGRRLRKGGVVFCRIDPIQQSTTQQYAVFRLCARKLVVPHRHKFSVFSSAPDTILQISKQDATTRKFTTIYRSQPVRDSFSPAWDRVEVDLCILCDGDKNTPLRFMVSMVRENKRAQMVGFIETTLQHVLAGASTGTGTTLPDPNDDTLPTFTLQRNVEKFKPVGQLVVQRAYLYEILPDGTRRVVEGEDNENGTGEGDASVNNQSHRSNYSFADIASLTSKDSTKNLNDMIANDLKSLAGQGCDLQVFVAIDFTSSNGDPRSESSLHYQSTSLNVYEETIATIVGSIEDEVNVSSGYTVWGFGAKFADSIVRHIFQCGSGNCHSVTEILDAYKNIFQLGFTMSGPTSFDKVMQATAVRAKKSKEQQQRRNYQYNVLLIITDGTMSDMEETRRKLTIYQDLPMSVIFVGVGRVDLRGLAVLCQEFPHESVFVDFREVQSNPAHLANAALGDLPRQIRRYVERCME